MAEENLEQFRQLVLRDSAVQQQLRATPDRTAFIELMVSLGRESGYGFTAQEVDEALHASRREWLEHLL